MDDLIIIGISKKLIVWGKEKLSSELEVWQVLSSKLVVYVSVAQLGVLASER